MNTPTQQLETAVGLATVDAAALVKLPDGDLVDAAAVVERLGRMVDGLRVVIASEVAHRSDRALGADGLAAKHGFRTPAELLEQLSGARAATVRRWIRVGEQVRSRTAETGGMLPALYPQTGAALESGVICLEQAEAITSELGQASPRANVDRLITAERMLLTHATGTEPDDDAPGDGCARAEVPSVGMPGVPLSADLIRHQARAWRDFLDPDGVEPRAEETRQHRMLWVSRNPDVHGLHPVRGGLTPDVAATVLAQFDAYTSPRRRPAFGPIGGTEMDSDATAATVDADVQDDRSPDQVRHDIFAAMVRAFAVSEAAASPSPLLISIDADQLEARGGTGTMSGSRSAFRRRSSPRLRATRASR